MIFFAFLFLLSGQIVGDNISEKTADLSGQLYEIRAYQLDETEVFVLDGVLDEAFWGNIKPAAYFTQQEPVEGNKPTNRTEVFVAYDASNLYIAARLYDDNPDQILAFQKRRNAGLGTDDRFMLILDTFNSGRTAYFFETNPNGMQGDGLLTVTQSASLNKSWNGIWEVKTNRDEYGWTLEMRIPFRTLDFDVDSDTWGINFQRTIRRNNEEIVWSGYKRNQGIFRPMNAGKLTGLRGLSQGLGIEIKPYVTGSGNRVWNQTNQTTNTTSFDSGFDVSYSITPGIRASLTINTDFAETEVDQRRINLTRFPLFFPEQRDFFLEGASIFAFAEASDIRPFFSRRIGLAAGAPVPVNAGLRVLGRTDNTTIGVYQIRTGKTNSTNAEDFTAARLVRNVFSGSSVGLIYTRRETHDSFLPVRQTLGSDIQLSTANFMGDKNLALELFFVGHTKNTPDEASDLFDRSARGFRVNFPNYPFYGSVSYREFGNAYDPALGFASRNGFRRLQPSIGFTHVFDNHRFIRSANIQSGYTLIKSLDYKTELSSFWLQYLNVQLESGEHLWGNVMYEYEYLPFSFDMLGDGRFIIDEGSYTKTRFFVGFSTATYRKLVLYAGYTNQGFWSGSRNQYEMSLTVRPISGFNISSAWNRDVVSLNSGSFHTDLFRFTGNFDFSTRLAMTSILQYDNLSEIMGLFSRVRWMLKPGSELFFVHTWNWKQVEDRFSPLETQAAVKLNYTYRF